MAVDLRRLATESRRTSIQLEQFIDRYTEKLGLSAAQAHILTAHVLPPSFNCAYF